MQLNSFKAILAREQEGVCRREVVLVRNEVHFESAAVVIGSAEVSSRPCNAENDLTMHVEVKESRTPET